MRNDEYFRLVAEQMKAAAEKIDPTPVEPEKVPSGSGDKVVDALLESSDDLSLSEEIRLFCHKLLAKIFGNNV